MQDVFVQQLLADFVIINFTFNTESNVPKFYLYVKIFAYGLIIMLINLI